MHREAKKQLFRLFLVLGAGVLVASLSVYYLLAKYDKDGALPLRTTLLSPEVLQSLPNHSLKLLVYDKKARAWKSSPLPLERYKKIYKHLEKDESLSKVSFQEYENFKKEQPVKIVIQAKKKGQNSSLDSMIMQEIEFSSHDYYRLYTGGEEGVTWLYFHHNDLDQELSMIR